LKTALLTEWSYASNIHVPTFFCRSALSVIWSCCRLAYTHKRPITQGGAKPMRVEKVPLYTLPVSLPNASRA